jgi:hypothetical protein
MSLQPRATICILTYGDFLPYFCRCYESVFKHTPRRDYELRIGFNDSPGHFKHLMGQLMPSYVVPPGPRTGVEELTLRDPDGHTVRLWNSAVNLYKEPMARNMFYKKPLTSEYMIWFDDDSFVEAGWWDELVTLFDRRTDYIGQEWWAGYFPGQTDMIRAQPWYRGVPFATRNGQLGVRFMTGGFTAIRTERLYSVNHPDTSFRWKGQTLKHNGGDTLLGEIASQLGWSRCRHDKHIKVNLDLNGNHPAPRRGTGAGRTFGSDVDAALH